MLLLPRKNDTPRPFLKWAGGKRSLLGRILPRLPKEIDTYVEPFLGGGAVFLGLAFQRAQGRVIKRAVLADRNPELVQAWTQVRDQPEEVIRAIEEMGQPDETRYYEVRAARPTDPVAQTARMLWLNRSCFNGLYRLNRSGEFNVPYGRYTRPRMVDAENLRAVGRALQDTQAEIHNADFRELSQAATLDLSAGAVVYADPPYLPASRTASFTAYDQLPFAMEDHEALADWFAALRAAGVKGLLSNNKTKDSVALYKQRDLEFRTVQVRRPINRDTSKRGPVPEVLVHINL